MRIGEVATESKVSVQTLRYYERRGLMPLQSRKTSGYRRYAPQAIQRVRFIRRAQDLGSHSTRSVICFSSGQTRQSPAEQWNAERQVHSRESRTRFTSSGRCVTALRTT